MLAKAIDYMLKRCPAFGRFSRRWPHLSQQQCRQAGETRQMQPLTQQKRRVVEMAEILPEAISAHVIIRL
jgi:hypothetical protein